MWHTRLHRTNRLQLSSSPVTSTSLSYSRTNSSIDMEAFTLCKGRNGTGETIAFTSFARSTNISNSAVFPSSEPNVDSGGSSDDDDDGPFFDLEFPLTDLSLEIQFKMTNDDRFLSSSTTSLTKDILFNGRLFTLESMASPEASSKPQLHSAVIKSATKLRVFLSKSNSTKSPAASIEPQIKHQGRNFIKFFKKGFLLRYMGKFKPFYVKASKLRFSGSIKDRLATQVGETDQSHLASSLPSRFKVAGGQLRKNRSASSVVVSVGSSRLLVPRRDDTLLQQEDGIQSAIAHCKRSFHAENGAAELLLSRSMSYPGGEKSSNEVRGESFGTENSTVF